MTLFKTFLAVLFLGLVFLPSPAFASISTGNSSNLDQLNFRWRFDDGGEVAPPTGATWRANTNTGITDISTTETSLRIRVNIDVPTNRVSVAVQPRLEFSSDATSCTDGSWTIIGTQGSASIWRLKASANFADGDNTTQQISSDTFITGDIYESTQTGTSITVAGNLESTEVEWSIEANGPAAGATYRFRATNAGTAFGNYSQCATLTTATPPSTFEQSAYRLFNNLDSTDVGTVLAAQDTAATLASTGDAFRLRTLLHVGVTQLDLTAGSFKLQFATRSGTCDTGFSGETYADVTAATAIAYNNNATPADAASLTANANDPTHGGDTIVNQTYEELNNFSNDVAAIPAGQDGKWDFALVDNGAPANTPYCFRVVKSDGSTLDTYSVIPEITTANAATVSCSTNISSTAFGSLSTAAVTTAVPNASTTMTCDGASGCTLGIQDQGDGSSPGLATSSPAYLIPSGDATLVAGTEGYGIQATTTASGSGGALTVNTAYNKTGNNVGGLAGPLEAAPFTLASSTAAVTGREVVTSHLAAISITTQASAYFDTITYSCVGN